MSSGFMVELPLSRSDEDGHYSVLKTITKAIVQDFRTLVLTNPGERVMDANFGVGMRRFLFEQNNEQTLSSIESRIRSQAKTYIPAIRINSINFVRTENSPAVDPNYVGVKIDFTIEPLKARQVLDILVS